MPFAKQTHCKQGHELTEANVYTSRRANGYVQRQCRVCRTADRRARQQVVNKLPPVERESRRKRFPSHAKMKHYQRKYRYGITEGEYRAMIHEQDGLCLICTTEGATHVDHDHATGRIRGILCGPCNRGLGLLNDDPDALMAAVEYLKGE